MPVTEEIELACILHQERDCSTHRRCMPACCLPMGYAELLVRDIILIKKTMGSFQIAPMLGLFRKAGCCLGSDGGTRLDCPTDATLSPKLGMALLGLSPLNRIGGEGWQQGVCRHR
jgi:hypothetical protein